jgi:hypothetical protein
MRCPPKCYKSERQRERERGRETGSERNKEGISKIKKHGNI